MPGSVFCDSMYISTYTNTQACLCLPRRGVTVQMYVLYSLRLMVRHPFQMSIKLSVTYFSVPTLSQGVDWKHAATNLYLLPFWCNQPSCAQSTVWFCRTTELAACLALKDCFHDAVMRLCVPKKISFLDLMVCSWYLWVFNFAKTSSLVSLCLQLILHILLRNHISHASLLSIRGLVKVHVSHPYNTTENT